MSEQSAPASAGRRASHEEDEITAFRRKAIPTQQLWLTLGSPAGATTATPVTSVSETVRGEQRVGHANDEARSSADWSS